MFYTYILIAVIVASMLVVYHRHKNLKLFGSENNMWIYLLINIGILPLTIVVIYITSKSVYKEIEYRGSYAKVVHFEEYWETWITETCSRQVYAGQDCTTDSEGRMNCTPIYITEYYDCSYCDKNEENFYVVDDAGNRYYLSKEKYKNIINKWKTPNIFHDLNRKINKNGKCGIDGDMYVKKWDNDIFTRENLVNTVLYENKGKSKHSSYYSYGKLDSSDYKNFIIYNYPTIYNDGGLPKQNSILGLDRLHISKQQKDTINILYDYINGNGENLKCKLFICLYPDMPIENAIKQKIAWMGGKRNELIVCIGYNSKTLQLNWVNSFGLSDSEISYVNIREEIMNNYSHLDLMSLHKTILPIIKNSFEPKDMKFFDYVSVTNDSWGYIVVYILIFLFGIISPYILYYIDKYN